MPSSYSRVEPAWRARALLGCCALLSVLCLTARSALAQPEPLVVVVSSSPEAPFVRRLAAELSLFGYRVQLATRAAGDDWPTLLARYRGAALIAVDPGRQTAEVFVGERAGSGPTRHDRERLDPRRQADTNAVVLAERFRARLTQLGIAPSPVAGAAHDPAAPAEPASSQQPLPVAEHRIWLGAALGASSGGLGLMPELQLEVRGFPLAWLSASAFGAWSPTAAQVTAREGSADVRLLAGGLLVDVYPRRGDLMLKLGLGAMLVNVSMEGEASPPWRGQPVSVLVPGGLFESGAALRLGPRVAVELRGFVGACAPRAVVRLAGRRAADFGQPIIGASLGLAVGVF